MNILRMNREESQQFQLDMQMVNAKEKLVIEIDGQFVPVNGRICINQCMINVTNLNNIQVGTQVTVYGLTPKNLIDSIAIKETTQ